MPSTRSNSTRTRTIHTSTSNTPIAPQKKAKTTPMELTSPHSTHGTPHHVENSVPQPRITHDTTHTPTPTSILRTSPQKANDRPPHTTTPRTRLTFEEDDPGPTDLNPSTDQTPTQTTTNPIPPGSPPLVNPRPIITTAPQVTIYPRDQQYDTVRYRWMLTLPPDPYPLKQFANAIKEGLTIIQDNVAEHTYILPWDPENDTDEDHPIWKTPDDIPNGDKGRQKTIFMSYFGGNITAYPNRPNQYFLKIRFGFGEQRHPPKEHVGRDANPILNTLQYPSNLGKTPMPCQATEAVTLGWLLYSSRNVSEQTFLPAVKKALNMPTGIAIGMQFRVIANPDSSRPEFNREDPPPQALHIEMDKKYAPYYQAAMAKLWRSRSNKRVNGCQFRLIPDTSKTQHLYRPITPSELREITHLKIKQKLFLKRLTVLSTNSISPGMLDHAIQVPRMGDKTCTLRDFIMQQHPVGKPTKRLFHNVDPSWTPKGETKFSTIPEYRSEADIFITTKMIPFALYRYGSEAASWFTATAITFNQSIMWDPDSAESVPLDNDDVVGLNLEEIWENIPAGQTDTGVARPAPPIPLTPTDTTPPIQTNNTREPVRNAINYITQRDAASFGGVYGRNTDDDTIAAPTRPTVTDPNQPPEPIPEITFDATAIDRDEVSEATGRSMSTAGQTTPSTRRELQKVKAQKANLSRQVQEQQELIARLMAQQRLLMTDTETIIFQPTMPPPQTTTANPTTPDPIDLTSLTPRAEPTATIDMTVDEPTRTTETTETHAAPDTMELDDRLPVNILGKKYPQIRTALQDTQADFAGFVEINLNFKILKPNEQWKDRTRAIFTGHSTHAYNRHNTSQARRLFGGAGSFCSHPHRVQGSGADPTGLGRWTWTTIQGINNRTIRIITGYRPVIDNTHNPGTVFSQHETYFASINQPRNPRQAFWDDLATDMQHWYNTGDSFILYLDANENVRDPQIIQWMNQWNLQDAHLSSHPQKPPSATCSKNQSNTPIDGVWMSLNLFPCHSGYLAYDKFPIGATDHRVLWVDIPNQQFFGFRTPTVPNKAPNRLALNDPRTIRRYNQLVKADYEHHQLPTQLFTLQQKTYLTTEEKTHYNQLTQLDATIRRNAQRQCRKLKMGAVEFSDIIQNDYRKMELWRILLKRANGQTVSSTTIRRLARQTNTQGVWTMDNMTLQTAQRETRKEYRRHKKIAGDLREAFHQQLIQRRAQHYGTSSATQAKLLKQAFRQKRCFRRIQMAMGSATFHTLGSLEETLPDGTTHMRYNKLSIETACAREGTARYTQSQYTPFLQEPLLTEVGLLAEGPATPLILNGTYTPPPQLDHYTKKLLTQLKRPESIPNDTFQPYITTQDFQYFWKHARHYTASSPYGPNFQDYIAGSYDELVSAVDATFASIPLLTGHLPNDWAKAIDVMIPKKTSSNHVTKLRIIVLFHALFNMTNKYIGKHLTTTAEAHNLLPWETFGSRKNKRAIDCALSKVLTNDISRQAHINMTLCSNDAKSCYDRIVHSVASISMQRLGTPSHICDIMFGTIQSMQHYIRTTYGDSAQAYSSAGIPLQGVLQGNGAGPAIWLIMTIPLINLLKAEGFGIHWRSPIQDKPFNFTCYMFVDDCDLVTSPGPNATPHALRNDMERCLAHWEGGLRATGGALVVEQKSYWYMIHHQFIQDKWIYSTKEQAPGNVQVRNHHGNLATLQRLEPHEAKETLGTWIAMDGNQEAQVRAIHQKNQHMV